MTTIWNPKLAGKPNPDISGRGWSSRLPTHLLIWLAAIALLALLILFDPSVDVASLRLPFLLTLRTLSVVCVAFTAFFTVFFVVNLVWAGVFSQLGRHRLLLVAMIAVFLTLLVAVNSAPISVYLAWLRRQEIGVWQMQVVALLLANAMLYYFFYGFFLDVYNESKQLYVKSARFKGATAFDYLREHASMVVLASLSPLFYYMVSFTLFTDYLLQSKEVEAGIVGYLFTLVIKSGGIDGAGGGFASPRFWAAFSVMLLVIVPIKYGLDRLRHWRASVSGLGPAQP